MGNNFTDSDKQKVVDFLNAVATHARFNVDTKELIGYFKGLSYMQQELIPKINDNILEVIEVTEGSKDA